MEDAAATKAELASILAEARAEREKAAALLKEVQDERVRARVEADRAKEDMARRVDRERKKWKRLGAEKKEEERKKTEEKNKEEEEAEGKRKEKEEAKRKEREEAERKEKEEAEERRKEEEKEKKRKDEEEEKRKEEEEKEAKRPRQRDYHWKRPYEDEDDEENLDETEFRFEGRLLPPAMRKMAAAAVQKTKDAADMKHHLCHIMSARKIACRLRKRGVMEVYFVLLSLGFQSR